MGWLESAIVWLADRGMDWIDRKIQQSKPAPKVEVKPPAKWGELMRLNPESKLAKKLRERMK